MGKTPLQQFFDEWSFYFVWLWGRAPTLDEAFAAGMLAERITGGAEWKA